MSVLELPASPGLPANVVMIRAKLPPHRAGDPSCVLPGHVAVVYPADPVDSTVAAATYVQSALSFGTEWRILGVTLDYIPFVHDPLRNGSWTADRHYAVAVAGLVPIAVHSAVLATATVGDPLYALPAPNHEYQFHTKDHVGVKLDCARGANGRLVGTIYGLPAAGENHCLVLLGVGTDRTGAT